MSTAPLTSPARKPGRKRKEAAPRLPLLLVQPVQPTAATLPRLERLERRGPVLRPSPLSEGTPDEVLSLNLLANCPLRCTFCYARAYPNYPGDEVAYFYANTAERLREELRQRRKTPRAVYLCPSTDPFPPFGEVQEEACRVMEVLTEHGIETWFMTRGFIRPFAIQRLARHPDLVKVTVSITTLDHRLSRTLEPLAAPPRLRLKQIAELRRLGVTTQVAIDPLIPSVTDTRENLEPLVLALGQAGVEHLTASYLFLRRGIRENLERDLGPVGWAGPILDAYQRGPVLQMGNLAPAKHLPRAERQRGYALLMALAAARGMTVSVCALPNPDFRPPRAHVPVPDRPLRQMVLQYPQ